MIKQFFKRYWLILAILAIAIFLRFWQLGVAPPSPDWDEAALGYNAFSVLKTGRDEYGTKFPLVLRSFDDYKPPLYMYLAIPFVAVFGLNVWSTRLPSAIMGVLAVLGTYLLLREWVGREKKRDGLKYLPEVVALLLAISPWHIQFSRIAFEANIGVTLNIWASYLFFRGLGKPWWLLGCAFLSALGLYAYHSERIFLPLMVIILGCIYWKDIWVHKKQFLFAIAVGAISVLPLFPVTFSKTAVTRLAGTSSLADQTVLLARSVKKLDLDKARGDKLGLLLDNRRLVWITTIAKGYLSHYSMRWLFLTGDNPRHHAPDMGLMYLWELPFWLYGMYVVARRGGRLRAAIFAWFFVAPLAASPTTELPHAIRTLVLLPIMQVFTGFGLVGFWEFLSAKKTLRHIMCCVVAAFAIWNFAYFTHMYFIHMNREVSLSWQYGYAQAVAYAATHKGQYKKVVVSTKLEQPHVFFLFYLQYDPTKYLASGGTASGGFAEVKNRFDIYEFRPIVWERENHDKSTLYIGTPGELPANLETIHYLDGSDAIHIGQ